MLANVKIDSPAGCTMVAGTLDGASDPSAPLDDAAMVCIIFFFISIQKQSMLHCKLDLRTFSSFWIKIVKVKDVFTLQFSHLGCYVIFPESGVGVTRKIYNF